MAKPEPSRCTSCGAPLPGGQPAGLCKTCRSKQTALAKNLRDAPWPAHLVTSRPESASHDHAATTLERVLGPEHPATLAGLHALANMLADQGNARAALTIFTRVLPLMQRVLGAEHPHALACAADLARAHQAVGELKQAETTFLAALPGLESAHGAGDVRTLQAVTDLAHVLEEQRSLAAAVRFAERAHRGFEAALGVGHHRTMTARLHLSYLQHELAQQTAKRESGPTKAGE